MAFKKVRISKKKNIKTFSQKASRLINKRNELMRNMKNSAEVDALNDMISDAEATINRNKILKHFQTFGGNPENVNLGQVWKTLDKLWPKCGESLPTAKKNHKGRIVSAPKDL